MYLPVGFAHTIKGPPPSLSPPPPPPPPPLLLPNKPALAFGLTVVTAKCQPESQAQEAWAWWVQGGMGGRGGALEGWDLRGRVERGGGAAAAAAAADAAAASARDAAAMASSEAMRTFLPWHLNSVSPLTSAQQMTQVVGEGLEEEEEEEEE